MQKRYCIISILFLLIIYTATPLFSDKLIPADNPGINYYGRFDFSTPSVAKFNWSGSTIEARFSGSLIGLSLMDGWNDYDITIDSKPYTILRTDSGTSKYIISDKLSSETHTIRISQRNESHYNVAQFKGFFLAENGQLLSAPEKPKRKIEFIGDSWTVGYGNESSGRTCADSSLRSLTNTNRSFPRLITDAFKAQSIILGWSGRGIVRNYGFPSKKSPDPFPVCYDRTLGAIDGIWDFSQWVPDVVVICLGINDFSTDPHPDDTMYYNGYHAFIGTIRTNYPDIPVICVSAHTGPMDTYVKKVVQDQLNVYGRKRIYFAETPKKLKLTGCHWHPNVADNSLIAEKLIGALSEVTGWETKNNSGIHEKKKYKHADRLSILRSGGTIRFTMSCQLQSAKVYITNLSGIIIKQGMISSDRNFAWNIGNIPSGIYLFNCTELNISKKIIISFCSE